MNLNNNKFKPGLYCVATPIGNMGDISFRAIKILQESDLILCEDTRVTKKILQKFEINKRLISNHKFNEKKNLEKVLEILKNKKIVSLVSDAGTPAVGGVIVHIWIVVMLMTMVVMMMMIMMMMVALMMIMAMMAMQTMFVIFGI